MESSFLTKKLGPLPIWAWAGIALVGLYLLRRQSSSAATSTPAATSSQPAAATESLTLPSGVSYSGPVGSPDLASVLNSAGAPGTGATSPGNGGSTPGQATATTTAVPTTVPNTVAPPTGPAAVNVGGQSLLDLGSITGAGGQYYGYEVGGGAPVLFGGPGGAQQLAGGPKAIEALPVGTEVYTPASNASLVSQAPGAAKF